MPVDVLSLVTEYVTGQRLSSFFRQQIGPVIGITTLQWAAFGTYTRASAYWTIAGRDMARVAHPVATENVELDVARERLTH